MIAGEASDRTSILNCLYRTDSVCFRYGIAGKTERMTVSPPPARQSSSQERPVIVLTGASGGIGVLIARKLVSRGCRVIALCRSIPDVDDAHCIHVPCDLDDRYSVGPACDTIHQRFGSVSAIIHCAGAITPAPVEHTDDASLWRQITINLAAPALVTRHLLPAMTQGGSILFVNSMAAVMPLAGSAIYASTKAGLRSLALSLAQELRPRRIRVGSVFPGAVQTAMLKQEMQAGGSILNFVSVPLAPQRVADTVVTMLDRPRSEQFLPALDGLFGRACMFAPPLLKMTLPLLTTLGRRGYRKAMRCAEKPEAKRNTTR